MKYQAEKQGESGFFDELATDATKLSEALEEFDRVMKVKYADSVVL